MEDDFKVPLLPPQQSTGATNPDSSAEEKGNRVPDQKQAENKSPADAPQQPPQLQKQQQCPYKEPSWSSKPLRDDNYKFEVLKSGKIIEEIDGLQSKPVWKFGRLPENDIEMAHPTISRFHAVLQYRPPPAAESDTVQEKEDEKDATSNHPAAGWYIYDLGSTHGTFLNKQRIPERIYIRIRVGWMLRLGSSTRSYILQGPSDDEEPESELSVTELRAQRLEQQNAAIAKEANAAAERERQQREEGISWGMAEDADEETDLAHNPYASTNNEELYLDDPKRTLRGYFEREDTPLEYKCDEMSVGSFVCRVELPIYDAQGRPVIAEVVHKGRKKDCVVQCALEACRILDRYGVLRQANQEPQKRKTKTQDSDSDDDSFWDRTGDIERRKQRKANAQNIITHTYEGLLAQETEVIEQLAKVESDIMQCQELHKRIKASHAQSAVDGDDELDNYMGNLSERPQLDKTEIRKLRMEQQRLKAEQQKLQRLIKISKPIDLPSLSAVPQAEQSDDAPAKDAVKKQLPLIGKRNQFSKFKLAKPIATIKATTCKALGSDEEEMEEEADPTTGKPIQETLNADELSGSQVLNEAQANEDVNTTNAIAKCDTLPTESSSAVSHKEQENPLISDASNVPEEQSTKKRRPRQRQRYKRHDVDVDELDEHEHSEKYAKWVPPENQSGDGFTKLNDKYGY